MRRRLPRGLGRAARAPLGRLLHARATPLERLALLAEHDPRGLRARAVQEYALARLVPDRDPADAANGDLLERRFTPARYAGELREAFAHIGYRQAGILNTDALLLWALLREARPSLYLESGTGRGYSAALAAEALARNGDGARIVTVGTDEPEVVATAREALAGIESVTMVEGQAQIELLPYLRRGGGERLAVFVDGPKGSDPSYIELLRAILDRSEPLFVAVHDCEAHLPRGFDAAGKWPRGRLNPNRSQLEYVYTAHPAAAAYRLVFMDSAWSSRYEDLNEAVYAGPFGIAPYRFKSSRQVSHSTVLGLLLRRDFAGDA